MIDYKSFGLSDKYFLREGVVYLYTNKINGKVYVGQTLNEGGRKRQHLSSANKKADNSPFHNAIAKNGIEAFSYSVLFRSTFKLKKFYSTKEEKKKDILKVKTVLKSIETYYISKYDSTNPKKGYNLSKGGEIGPIGYDIKSEDYRKRLSESKMGHPVLEETRRKISLSNKGKPFTEEARQKMKKTVEERNKNGDFFLTTGKATPVVLCDLEGNIKGEFVSTTQASKKTGYCQHHIHNHINKKGMHRSYVDIDKNVWMFKSDYDSLKDSIFPMEYPFHHGFERKVKSIDENTGDERIYDSITLAVIELLPDRKDNSVSLNSAISTILKCCKKNKIEVKYKSYGKFWTLLDETYNDDLYNTPVLMLDPLDETVLKEFPSIVSATEEIESSSPKNKLAANIKFACINLKLDGSRRVIYKHKWKYAK